MDVYNSYPAMIAVVIFFMGTCIFSFLNVIIYRVPRKMDFVKGDRKSTRLNSSHT